MAARCVQAVAGHRCARILDTRKTTPGAARAREGRGRRRRRHQPPRRPVRRDPDQGEPRGARRRGGRGGAPGARTRAPELPLEVECRTLAEVDEALAAGRAGLILLDNMSADAAARGGASTSRGRAKLEASGGFTLETLRAVASTGVDFISVGALTHSAPALDLSLLLEPIAMNLPMLGAHRRAAAAREHPRAAGRGARAGARARRGDPRPQLPAARDPGRRRLRRRLARPLAAGGGRRRRARSSSAACTSWPRRPRSCAPTSAC